MRPIASDKASSTARDVDKDAWSITSDLGHAECMRTMQAASQLKQTEVTKETSYGSVL